jgi:SAM-dependent methyltransferase
MTKPWYEDDSFWETFGPYMFTDVRMASARSEVEQLIALLRLRPAAAVLDLCCGVGRHSLEFARRDFAVTGVDRTVAYLERARQAAAAGNLAVEFVQSDMRSFMRPGAFDGAISFFSSFGYFEDSADDLRVARNLHDSLRPGGRLVIETMAKEILARTFKEREVRPQPDGTFLIEERHLESGWGRINSRWILAGPNGLKEGRLSVRPYSGVELTMLLKQAGFTEVTLYANLACAPYDHTAERLVAVAVK